MKTQKGSIMKKSVRATAAISAAVALAFSGCAQNSAPQPDPTQSPTVTQSAEPTQSVVQLSFWSGFTGGNAAGFKAMIDEFNATHPYIQVAMDPQPWDTIAQKLPTAIASDSGPDLATPDFNQATLLQYVSNDLALPLDAVFGDTGDLVPTGVIPSSILSASTVDGKVYSAPATYTTLMLYYNKELLKAAGIDGPPKTMEELQKNAVALTGDGVYGIALPDHNTIANWPILIWADGGDIVRNGCSALADDATIGAVSKWSELIQTEQISPVGLTGQDASNLFSAGKAGFVINGPNAAAGFKQVDVEFDVAPVPTGSTGAPVTLASTIPIIVSANTKHPAEAQEFLRWWLSPDAQLQLALQTGAGPVRTDIAGDPSLQEDALLRAFASQVPNGRLLLPTEPDFGKINANIFVPAIQAAQRTADVASVLKDASKQLDDLLGC